MAAAQQENKFQLNQDSILRPHVYKSSTLSES
jgi:hypothetical protein